jgi:hypothetical protein
VNNPNVGEYIVMYTEGKGKEELPQYQSFWDETEAWNFFREVFKKKGVNRDTVTIYKQL